VFYGEITNEKNRTLPDCNFREKLILTIIVVVIIAMGVYPQPFLRRMDKGVESLMLRMEKHTVIMTDRAPVGRVGVGR
jgi:NADH-quinone oxidoreductase subunit M